MENSMEVPLKTKIELPYGPNPIVGHISGEIKGLKGYMDPSVHCSTVYNRQDMKAC